MNYMNILQASSTDFSNWSVVLQVSHCIHMCDGCFNKSSWSKNAGELFTEEDYQRLIIYASASHISNVVIQGGDPLSPLNIKDVITLCKRIRKELPNKNIVIFTGYTIEEIQNDNNLKEVLNYCDIIVDGKYDKDLPPAPFRGSSNQRIIEVKNL